jgi:hypothetical protein
MLARGIILTVPRLVIKDEKESIINGWGGEEKRRDGVVVKWNKGGLNYN